LENKKREYPKDKSNELAINSKNKNMGVQCKGINEFKKKSYQHRNDLVKGENGELLADSHISIFLEDPL
jgi:hypothetical protein